ncbi:MAG: hypothetical protein PHG14_14700 [Desulfobacter postgatei]|uniref:hypothetical protein n=1 Tax=Desulfobacter postgatei TaxID=2293 RepID=UPI0023F164CE|nr:hypothetical protein [Desulfobacter postgatei]MDD4274963.1 hypothetical protein [Desulfobacter postgatei]
MTAFKAIKIDTSHNVWRISPTIDTYAYDSEMTREFVQKFFIGKTSRLNITYRH